MGSPFLVVGGLGDVYKSISPNENGGPGEDNNAIEGSGPDKKNDPRKASDQALHEEEANARIINEWVKDEVDIRSRCTISPGGT
ncbi:UNVERIFIED_CONTAM: hypothetical protein Sradi_5262500 [Sesamum radiatum]|uniref:Uncharacterized protein n=1 Tax=Sesamum radiatum TaxID=300843 RepID=A0AAW2LLB9_SESRA